MTDKDYRVDILKILRSIVFEKNHPLLDGMSPDSKFILGNNLSFQFTILQLGLVDVGLVFTFFEISRSSALIFSELFTFLVALNSFVFLVLHYMVSRTNTKMTNEHRGYLYLLKFPFCNSCKVDMTSIEDALLHKIDNPQHTVDHYEVRTRVNNTIRFLNVFRLYEIMFLLVVPILISVFGGGFQETIIFSLILSFYIAIPIIYAIRYLRRKHKVHIARLLYVNHDDSYHNDKQEVFTFRLIMVNKRYLKNGMPIDSDFPVLKDTNGESTYLIEHYEVNLYGMAQVEPYKGLTSGLYYF